MNKAKFVKAIRNGDTSAVSATLDMAVDVNFRIERGQTALHLAAAAGNYAVLELLLKRDADPNILDDIHETPLDVATKAGHANIERTLISCGAESSKAIIQRREKAIREQSWSNGFCWQTIRALAKIGIASEEAFLALDHWPVFDSKAHDRQRTLKIEKGLLDPKEPCSSEEIGSIKGIGGLFFRGDTPLFSLGSHRAPQGKFLCVSRGRIYWEDCDSAYAKDTAFKTLHCRLMSKIDKQYGVFRRSNYSDWSYDLKLTLQIFGLDFDSLERTAQVYYNTFYHELNLSSGDANRGLCRVTCSNTDNHCSISSNYIPAGFPFIAFCDTMYWPGHVSLGAFLDTLRFITFNFREHFKSMEALKASGLTPELITLAQCADGLNFRTDVTFDEVQKW